ncbi:Rieske 2Fe-2S domain-containing protein [Marinobacter sp. S6332]|uniref:Rieske (2Fe-2S) protein n=1 Tax=Marinobacter sp. S6332 TaxID=2926403 RepID=UPI001FF2F3C2|nr:Rieske 2Fe-2S domain-containing protein [Marinobacter sp. S6332]MCK0165243.1 Rieske 2Fe-2S domain-containing protein [Marinobacter sp. S6332]
MTSKQISPWQPVCDSAELQPGQFVEFTLAQVETSTPMSTDTLPLTGFVFLDGGTPRAYLNRCPHMGVELNWKPGCFMDVDNLFLQCSTHGALFKPQNGECIAGPCQGDALTELDLQETEGVLEVKLPE